MQVAVLQTLYTGDALVGWLKLMQAQVKGSWDTLCRRHPDRVAASEADVSHVVSGCSALGCSSKPCEAGVE